MQAPEIPENETQRVAALHALNVLFTPSEERFDRITRLASRLLGTPIALVTLVTEKLQWFKSVKGLDTNELPRESSFCGHAILGDETFVVGNAARDPRFADNPLVTGSPFIRAYAGHPLHASDGSRVGTLCVIDRKPRKFKREQLEILRDLAAIVELELLRGRLEGVERDYVQEMDEAKRNEDIDAITHLWNQVAVMRLLEAELARASRGAPTCVALADADYAGDSGPEPGSPADNAVLVELAARIRRAVREFDVVGYCGGKEFIIVLSNCSPDAARLICERICGYVDYEPVATPEGLVKASISIGLAVCDAELDTSLGVVAAADAALSTAKARGGNRVETHGP